MASVSLIQVQNADDSLVFFFGGVSDLDQPTEVDSKIQSIPSNISQNLTSLSLTGALLAWICDIREL